MEDIDYEHAMLITKKSHELLGLLDSVLPRSEKYSHVNLSLNLLVGALFLIGNQFMNVDGGEKFIQRISNQLRENFDAAREN